MENLISLAPQHRVWMTLGRDFKKRGAALMHQQCGLWGHDVRRQVDGTRQNALLELGFHRTPPPDGVLGATTYARTEPDGCKVTLWGFGMHFGDHRGGIFLSRFAFCPRLSDGADFGHAWMPSQLLETHRAPRRAGECLAALDYLRGALSWIAGYEREIEARFGPGYRARALQAWHKAPDNAAPNAANIAREWDELAALCETKARFYGRFCGRNREVSRAELETALSVADLARFLCYDSSR